LAHEGPKQRFSTKLLQRYNLPHSTVSVALKNLVKMGLVWPREMGGWSLVDPLLALWFKGPRGD
jgi:DNA-binding IclR family transcriptional regulator